MVTIKQGKNKFFVGENEEEPLAEITFTQSGDTDLIVDHTFVQDELRGEGVAGKLVERVVKYAREEGKKIIPECSYAKNKIEKTPEYHDVLSKK
ncbi:GNAT family N-acetyltransferase [Virgibacillus dakarensis]|uniref:N-acetyltransferase n=1 Tax=Lentibacillus populi TaxID=1827502 RepID=A0A9W5X698_9BACI|nr:MULTISPECIES: GNAT family N-acetyltransferase [Bacillaceae]MBT2217352.1 N-acetyltransferase [Virgibacillus dakarensis]MTW87368.1 GNAT family N-acetyltransferase [Virgibacillus dakarensis]GGB50803.1 N-acetyltransferase [Lentibacillus populi]